jgi:hypothetical protein
VQVLWEQEHLGCKKSQETYNQRTSILKKVAPNAHLFSKQSFQAHICSQNGGTHATQTSKKRKGKQTAKKGGSKP